MRIIRTLYTKRRMNKLLTVATFTMPSEMHVAKSKLESEGIKCYTLNELTVQSHNFISNAIGGIKLQVHEKDSENAISLLKEFGYTFDEVEQLNWVHQFLASK